MTNQLRVSATLFTTWKRCPKQAAARLAGHYPADTINSFRGLLAHQVFATHLNQGPITPTDFDKTCRQLIGSSQLNWKMRDLGLKPSQVTNTIAEVADLYRRFTTIKPSGQGEVHVEADLDAATLIGTIDCVQTTETPLGDWTRLIDWKTGELGEVADQLAFYALAWTLSGQPLPLAVEAVSVATGERYSEWVNQESIHTTSLEVVEMVADLTTPDYDPDPEAGPYCRWCPILDDCEEGTRAMELVP